MSAGQGRSRTDHLACGSHDSGVWRACAPSLQMAVGGFGCGCCVGLPEFPLDKVSMSLHCPRLYVLHPDCCHILLLR